MKTFILFFIAIAFYANAQAQTVAPFVINSTGGSFQGNGISLDYSVGEVIVTEIKGSGFSITQGFLQADFLLVNALEDEIYKSITYFPNPTLEQVQINSPHKKINSVQVINLAGKTVLEASPNQEDKIDLKPLQSGIYLLKLLDDKGKTLHLVRIVKH